ncbi:hypothetical protein ABZ725_52455 [Streptomyces sp. NPDC006872]|uniref:hypothetical protein n=1 Tax=Streptomyces sp. NPDC006872 TaxID=3155720 RepID=UPI0033DBB114
MSHQEYEDVPAYELGRRDRELTPEQSLMVQAQLVDFLNSGHLSAARILVHRFQERSDRSQGQGHYPEATSLATWARRQVETFAAEGLLDHQQYSVPKELNFVWMGRPMEPAAVANVLAWTQRAEEAGWQVKMWTDTKSGPGGQPVSRWDPQVQERMKRAGVSFHEITDVLPLKQSTPTESWFSRFRGINRTPQDPLEGNPETARLRDVFANARTTSGAFPVASDVARYAILKRGGGYADVDIDPGLVDLKQPMAKMGREDLPILAPMLRDRHNLTITRQEAATHLEKPVGEVTMEDAALYRFKRAEYNNNFIIVPPDAEIISQIIKQIPEEVTHMGGADLAVAGASATGPLRVAQALAEHVRRFDLGTTTAAEEGAALDPTEVARWAKANWVTEESDNQDYGMGSSPFHTVALSHNLRDESIVSPHGGRKTNSIASAAHHRIPGVGSTIGNPSTETAPKSPVTSTAHIVAPVKRSGQVV